MYPRKVFEYVMPMLGQPHLGIFKNNFRFLSLDIVMVWVKMCKQGKRYIVSLYCTLERAEYLPGRYKRGAEWHFFRKKQTITDLDLLPLSEIIPPIIHCFDKGTSDIRISSLEKLYCCNNNIMTIVQTILYCNSIYTLYYFIGVWLNE